MVKCVDHGVFTCISKNGNPKSRWDTSEEAIIYAKYLNNKFHKDDDLKLVGYKCTHCYKYHLTTHTKRKRNWEK